LSVIEGSIGKQWYNTEKLNKSGVNKFQDLFLIFIQNPPKKYISPDFA
jgi:hypothetical protein